MPAAGKPRCRQGDLQLCIATIISQPQLCAQSTVTDLQWAAAQLVMCDSFEVGDACLAASTMAHRPEVRLITFPVSAADRARWQLRALSAWW